MPKRCQQPKKLKDFMNHAQWDHKYDDCGLTLHFKVGTCGVQAYFLHIPSIFELSTPACLAWLAWLARTRQFANRSFSISRICIVPWSFSFFYLPLFYYNLNEFRKIECLFLFSVCLFHSEVYHLYDISEK